MLLATIETLAPADATKPRLVPFRLPPALVRVIAPCGVYQPGIVPPPPVPASPTRPWLFPTGGAVKNVVAWAFCRSRRPESGVARSKLILFCFIGISKDLTNHPS